MMLNLVPYYVDRAIVTLENEEIMTYAKENGVSYELVKYVKDEGKLPVVNFAAGGVAIPADVALLLQIGVEGVFVGSGIFKSENPAKMAKAMVDAAANYNNPDIFALKGANALGTEFYIPMHNYSGFPNHDYSTSDFDDMAYSAFDLFQMGFHY